MAQFAHPEPKKRARLEILNYICAFSLQRQIDGHTYSGLRGMSFIENRDPPIGALVSPSSGPFTKWYLSWVHKVEKHEFGGLYVLESIEDHELCNWSNVSVLEYPPWVNNPRWRWTDEQFQFNDRWIKTCDKLPDGYMYRGIDVRFDGEQVALRVRRRYEGAESIRERLMLRREATIKRMAEVHAQLVKEKSGG